MSDSKTEADERPRIVHDRKAKKDYYIIDGVWYPLEEAVYDTAFKVYRTDNKKAKIGNPRFCVDALGLRRGKNVIDAWVGTGRDAYVVYGDTPSKPAHAVHFLIAAKAAEVRDNFDNHQDLQSQLLMLKAPPAYATRNGRRAAQAKWRDAVKNGKEVNKRGPQQRTRLNRLGLQHRPRPIHQTVSKAKAETKAEQLSLV